MAVQRSLCRSDFLTIPLSLSVISTDLYPIPSQILFFTHCSSSPARHPLPVSNVLLRIPPGQISLPSVRMIERLVLANRPMIDLFGIKLNHVTRNSNRSHRRAISRNVLHNSLPRAERPTLQGISTEFPGM
jgi:hypothetical protein